MKLKVGRFYHDNKRNLWFYRNDNLDEVKKILTERPFEIEVANSDLRTPLHEAAALNRVEVLQLFCREETCLAPLSTKDVSGSTPTMLAVRNDAPSCVDLLFKAAKKAHIDPGK